MPFNAIYLGLGSNLGERRANIQNALEALAATPGVNVLACSTLHESAAVGGPPGQPPYLNAVAEVDCVFGPRMLLRRLLAIEAALGRERRERFGPRPIDLDILLFRDLRISEPGLTIPHPRMWERPFVIEPLTELCGEARLAELRQEFAPYDFAGADAC